MRARFLAVSIGLLVGILTVSATGSYYLVAQYQHLSGQTGTKDEVLRMRNGVFALYDLMRTRAAVEQVIHDGHLNDAAGEALLEAVDHLFVRNDALRRQIIDIRTQEADNMINALDALIAALDGLLATPDRITETEDRLHRLLADASRAIVQFYDEQKSRHLRAVERDREVLQRLTYTSLALIATFMVIAGGAVLLWRAESLARIRRREAEDRANKLAYFDGLTGLPNRANFHRRATKMMSTHARPVLFMIDLDDFKLVNDTHGHQIGDAVLRLVAARLSTMFASRGGFAARLGGDEFAAMLPAIGESINLDAFIGDLVATVAVPETREGVQIAPRISVGAATPDMLDTNQPPSLDALSRAADFALYEAKAAGRYVGRIYDQNMAARLAERNAMKHDLPNALARGDLFVEFQPQFDLRTGKLHGFEALARWERNGANVPPDVFIEIAEQDDLIMRLDCWVLREALKCAVNWNQLARTPVRLSTNLSTRSFRAEGMVSEIRLALEASGLKPELLTLEITETVLAHDWTKTLQTLNQLTALGVRIALDNFGTGYSSLSYLKQLNVHEVKIDRSFVSDLENSDRTAMLLDALVDISRALHMQLTVEGIETEGQAQILTDLGAHVGQGFLYSWPVRDAEVRRIVLSGMRIGTLGTPPQLVAGGRT